MTYLFSRAGLTLIELVMATAILAILASAAVPLTQMSARRTREVELRRNLREIRTAIDEYKKIYDKAVEQKKIMAVTNRSGYPKTLELLVEGDNFGGLYQMKRKFLRRIPTDPLNRPADGEAPVWGLRSYFDKPGSAIWGKQDIFDVYSQSEGVAIDGSSYKDW